MDINGSFNLCDVRDLAHRTIIVANKGKKLLMTTFFVYNLARNNSFDSSKAKKELGYTTCSYAETIREQVCWLKKEVKIK